ncbi:hypothetical protein BC938DRAFT_483545 [Jimgerdemannia flammicorona]|uniref:6-pyruvoyl tetrahydrobiopterin synthase n=1 Tax=Jimgerdemannia flammicorona TaxID=994334 RepID=A0A433R099_9FUNG|nr:hypothetical protein BC938DRAFT_483545 [Jimgerdemannia flammicorona]
MSPIAYVSRIESFSSAHRLHSPFMNTADNVTLYGKCTHSNFHGHNYKVEVTIQGHVHPQTGMVINISDLKQCMQVAIMDVLDHKNLDLDVPYFSKIPSTTENLALFIWRNFSYHFASLAAANQVALYEIRLHETDRNSVVFRGEGGDGALEV